MSETTIRCSRVGPRKKDVEWVYRWFKKNGMDVTIHKNQDAGAWIVRGRLGATKLAEFCGLEARKEQSK